MKEFIDFLRDEMPEAEPSLEYLEWRKRMLQESSGTKNKGLSEGLFYPRISTSSFEELRIRKNFAFFNFENYVDHVSQSDIYFTISNIINSLRSSENHNRNLTQSVFVRNLLSPANFDRFNDGIIQSSILRAATNEELAYSISTELSEKMLNTLEILIKDYTSEQGEALVEFIYALAVRKLALKKEHLNSVVNLLDRYCKEELFKCFTLFIKEKILK